MAKESAEYKMTLFVLIPVYNESGNIKVLSENLIRFLEPYNTRYVFVDDGSVDNSRDMISKYFVATDFIILGDGNNHGPGYSFNIGFNWILDNSNSNDDKVVTMEADNTSDITLLSKMLAISDLGYDLVLASIYVQGGSFSQTGMMRKVLSLVANLFLRFIFNIKIQTLSSFYRVFSISVLNTIKQNYNTIISESGFISMIELLIKAIKSNASIIEVPMKLDSSNRVGKSKMKIFKNIISYLKFLIYKRF